MKKISIKKISYISAITLAAVIIISAYASPTGSLAEARCQYDCGNYNISKGGTNYSAHITGDFGCHLASLWPNACNYVLAETTDKISPDQLSASWTESCGNVHSYSGTIVPSAPPALPDPCPGGMVNPAYTSYVQANVTPIIQEYYRNFAASKTPRNNKGLDGGGSMTAQVSQFKNTADLQKKIQDALVGAPASCIYPDPYGCYSGTTVNPEFAEYAKQMNDLMIKQETSNSNGKSGGAFNDSGSGVFNPQTRSNRDAINALRTKMYSIARCLNVNIDNKTTTTVLDRECTPGIDCPEMDLGKIIEEARVGRAYAGTNNTCPFFYRVGAEDGTQKISCSIVSNGRTTVVPKINPDNANGYPLPVGRSTFVCIRGGMSTTTESSELVCNGNPNVIEH